MTMKHDENKRHLLLQVGNRWRHRALMQVKHCPQTLGKSLLSTSVGYLTSKMRIILPPSTVVWELMKTMTSAEGDIWHSVRTVAATALGIIVKRVDEGGARGWSCCCPSCHFVTSTKGATILFPKPHSKSQSPLVMTGKQRRTGVGIKKKKKISLSFCLLVTFMGKPVNHWQYHFPHL